MLLALAVDIGCCAVWSLPDVHDSSHAAVLGIRTCCAGPAACLRHAGWVILQLHHATLHRMAVPPAHVLLSFLLRPAGFGNVLMLSSVAHLGFRRLVAIRGLDGVSVGVCVGRILSVPLVSHTHARQAERCLRS